MDGKKAGTAVNGANGSDSKQNENEAKEKVNKTLLLRQQIEENRQALLHYFLSSFINHVYQQTSNAAKRKGDLEQ